MDAVKFIKERQRMCSCYTGACVGCPLEGEPCGGYRDVDAERVVGAVEEWSAAHPRKTRQSVFLEMFADAKLDKEGHINLCPVALTNEKCGLFGKPYECCCDCRRDFWMQEVE